MTRAHLFACSVLACGIVALLAQVDMRASTAAPLRVCADPNNLPFSNDRREGFENRLAEMLASELHTRLEYTWFPQRRGFLRNTLNAGRCDVVIGMPARIDQVLTTEPYYTSTYVFISAHGRYPHLTLDDPRLRTLRIGVQMIGDDFANSPPAHALSARGITRNVVGYSVLGDYSRPNPPSRIVDALSRNEVDIAIVWGPVAGYFTRRAHIKADIVPVDPSADGVLPFTFPIAMAVRRNDVQRVHALDQFLRRRRTDIDRLLEEYAVPRVDRRAARGGS